MLTLAPNLTLPLDAATRRLAILAMSGAGKSNVAVVLAEQMFQAGIPWVAVDPKGDWWGVRSSKDGKRPGLPIPIFGGLHADVPLEPTPHAGREIAAAIVDQRLTCVLDISEFTDRQAMWGFLAAFGEVLLHKNKAVLHLFLEEADEYLPQRTSEKGNLPRCLGVWQRLVKRGRFRGIGCTQITQRSAALNKDTLYQAELLIALRASGKGDRDAIKGWIEHHDAAVDIIASLPGLRDGEGWVTSPAWLRETRLVNFNRRQTFDSGSTPVLLEQGAKPATLADIDLSALRVRMAAAIDRAKADDPAELRKRIADLERALAAKPAATVQTEYVTVLTLPPGAFDKFVSLERDVVAMREQFQQFRSTVRLPTPDRAHLGSLAMREYRGGVDMAAPDQKDRTVRFPDRPQSSNGHLPAGELAVLTAVAQSQPDSCTREYLTVMTGYKRSSRDTYLQRLQAKGLIDGMTLTKAGFAALGPSFTPLPTGTALRRYWLDRLPAGEAAILEHTVSAYPDAVGRHDLDAKTGYKRSSRDTYIQRLSARGLVVSASGGIKASPHLFGNW